MAWARRWWENLPPIFKLIGTICGAAAAIAGMIISIPPAWSSLGLPEVATHTYVHEQVDPIRIAQTSTTAAVDRLVLIQLKDALYKAQTDPAAGASPIVQERIQTLEQEIERTQARVNASGAGR